MRQNTYNSELLVRSPVPRGERSSLGLLNRTLLRRRSRLGLIAFL